MMKFFDIDWMEIFAMLPVWDAISLSSRKAFLNPALGQNQSQAGTAYGEDLKLLLDAGIIQPGAPGRFKPADPRGVQFRRVIMQMSKFLLFEPGSTRETVDLYVAKHFLNEDAGRMLHQSNSDAHVSAGSEAWVRSFLDSKDPCQWEEKYKGYESEVVKSEGYGFRRFRAQRSYSKLTYLKSEAIAETAQRLVRLAIDSPTPLSLLRLGEAFPGTAPQDIADAFKAGVRYLLLFPALRADSYEAVFWIRPSIGNRLHRPPAKKPKPIVPVEEISITPFLLEDISLVAARAVSESLPVKKGSWHLDLFEKARKELLHGLGDLPALVSERFTRESRLSLALSVLQDLKFISAGNAAPKRITVSKAGRDWLLMPASVRLQALIDAFRKHRKLSSNQYYGGARRATSYSPTSLFQGKRYSATPVDGPAWIDAVWTQAEEGAFFQLDEWLHYHSHASPPPGVNSDTPVFDGYCYREATVAEGGEEVFKKFHETFFFSRLIPLGGVKLGQSSDRKLCFALNATGCHLLQGTGSVVSLDDATGNVVVQPNFEVVFMQPSPLAEAELAGLAERCGHRLGAIFRLTKASALKSALAGNTAVGMLKTLARISNKPLPENVRHQITDWFGNCRDVEVRQSLILTTPDKQTAVLIASELGDKCQEIAPQTLEFRAAAIDAKVIKKLEARGVFFRKRQASDSED